MSVEKLNSQNAFKEALKSQKLVAVDFYANWCGPCRVISPKFEAFAKDYTTIKFYKVHYMYIMFYNLNIYS